MKKMKRRDPQDLPQGAPTLGQWIYHVRHAKNFTQEDLAEEMGVDVRTIQRWEADAQVPHSALFFHLIAIQNKVSPEEITAVSLKALFEMRGKLTRRSCKIRESVQY